MGSFEDVFKHVASATKKDPHSRIFKSGDVNIGGSVPYGILSGIPRLDFSIGRPGLPAGRVVEYFGFEMSGKTTAAFHALAQAQHMGGGGLYIDAEFAWDEDRARDVGIDPDTNFFLSQVDTIEGIFRQLASTIVGITEKGLTKPFVAIVDSITAVSTEHEKEKEFGEVAKVGIDAKVIRDGMRKLMPLLSKTNVCLIFVNHATGKIGANKYAKQSEASGGHAIKFYSTLRCEFTNGGAIRDDKDKDLRLGQNINIEVAKLKKSRLERPKIKLVGLYGENGFDLTEELFQTGKQYGMIKKINNMTYKWNDTEFVKKQWPEIVNDNGGPQDMYGTMIAWGIDNGLIKPWSDIEYS